MTFGQFTELHSGGKCVGGDSGGLIWGKRVDVFLDSEAEAREFGRQMVVVEVKQ